MRPSRARRARVIPKPPPEPRVDHMALVRHLRRFARITIMGACEAHTVKLDREPIMVGVDVQRDFVLAGHMHDVLEDRAMRFINDVHPCVVRVDLDHVVTPEHESAPVPSVEDTLKRILEWGGRHVS